jgi:hypothetical protein
MRCVMSMAWLWRKARASCDPRVSPCSEGSGRAKSSRGLTFFPEKQVAAIRNQPRISPDIYLARHGDLAVK